MYGIVCFIMVTFILFYHRASLSVWTISISIFYLAYLKWSGFHFVSSFSLLLIIALLLFLQVPWLRRYFLIRHFFKLYATRLPSMSRTEQEAISAGTVTWEGEIFKGKPNWHALLTIPPCQLTEEEQAFLDGPTETLCKMLNEWEITHHLYDLPPAVWAFIKESGFFALIIPKKYGGKEFSAYAHSQVITKVSSVSVTASVTIAVPNSLGPVELLLHYGTVAQQNYYLPRLATGEEVPCFALTSEEAGSDASSMTDYGILERGEFEGETIVGIRLQWSKRYITLAPIATVIGLAFKLYDPHHLLGEEEDLGITCALIPRNTQGVTIGRRHFTLNCPFQNGPIQGKDVFIPLDWVIGGRQQIGKGWRMLMECLAAGRGITLPSNAAGCAKAVSRSTSAYARIRSQFGLPIGRFEGVQEPLAYLAAYNYIIDAARQFTIAKIMQGEKPAIASAIIKYHTTELARKSVMHGMDIHGGKGICLGPRNYLGRGYQFTPIAITVEGANILTRNLMIFGQGLMRCHPYLYAEIQAIQNPDAKAGLMTFDKVFTKHIGFVMSNIVRTIVLSLTSARFISVPASPLRRYFQQASRFSAAFALLSDVSMLIYGATLKRKENISARLGDILSHLYLLSALIKHFHDEGQHKEDLPLATFACDYCLYQMQCAFTVLFDNFKSPFLARLLQWVIFPWGKRFRQPSDVDMTRIVHLMLSLSATRSRLVKGMSSQHSSFVNIDNAMQKVIATESIEKRIKQARDAGVINGYHFIALVKNALSTGLISDADYEALIAANVAKNNILKVDDFSNEELIGHCS